MRAMLLAVVLLGCARAPANPDTRVVARDGGPSVCGEPGEAEDGMPCACAADCRAGALCVDESSFGYPGGVCLRLCDLSRSDECSPGTSCLDLERSGTGEGLCYRSCVSSSDCPRGRLCVDGVCSGRCADDGACESGRCDRYASRCVDPAAVIEGAGLNAPCTRHDECRSAFCDPERGLCVSLCSVESDHCPEGSVCIWGDAIADVGVCAERCERTSDCAEGLRCGLDARPGFTERVCLR